MTTIFKLSKNPGTTRCPDCGANIFGDHVQCDRGPECWVSRFESGTAQTNAQRQEALRARRAIEGLTEVRGIYLPPAMHAKLKEQAAKLMRTVTKDRLQAQP